MEVLIAYLGSILGAILLVNIINLGVGKGFKNKKMGLFIH